MAQCTHLALEHTLSLGLNPPDAARNPGFPASSSHGASSPALPETPFKSQSKVHEASLFNFVSHQRVC